MNLEPLAKETKVSYDSEAGEVNFDFTFDEDTEITGYMKLHLWVEAQHTEMDLDITVLKLDEDGNWLPTYIIGEPHPGTWGRQRVSMREPDKKLSSDFEPIISGKSSGPLVPGEIYPVDISIVPSSKIWHKGQKLRVRICGRYIREGWFEPLAWDTDNKGEHIIHTGGKYDSYLQVPVIPPKYQTKGGYTYR